MTRWQAALFDLDGVLADSAVLHYVAWQRHADDLGISSDTAANEALKGVDRMARCACCWRLATASCRWRR